MIRSGTVSVKAGRFYVSVLVEIPDINIDNNSNEGIGIDPVSYTHLDVYKRQIKKQRRIRAGQTETCSGIFGSISEIWKNHSVMIILAGAVVLLQCLIVIFYEDTTVRCV